jgi:beta-lactamase superfamily II metal-dependent hydrolase
MRTPLLLILLIPSVAAAQANGHLQIHYLNVGQGDAALIVSPLGQTMLVDTGPFSAGNCASATGIITQLTGIGVTRLDYHVASHYDADHIGCSDHVVARFPLQQVAYDRGTSNPPSTQTYTRYATAVAGKRQAVSVGQQIVLDGGSSAPVTFQVVAVNGNGTSGSLTENDRGVVVVLHFGSFDAEFGGDLSGDPGSSVHNIESLVAPAVGQIEVYKVHHHGSATSSNTAWMTTTHPRIAVLSVGSPNAFDHPRQVALDRIRSTSAVTYWTTGGDGAPAQSAYDVVVNGTIQIDVPREGTVFTVRHGAVSDTYTSWGSPAPFTDDPLVAGAGLIRIVHLTELRTRIDAVRTRFGLAAYPYADLTLAAGVTPIKAQHFVDLRSALAQAYVIASRTQPTYTDASLGPGVTMKAAHIAELRAAVLAIE